MASGTPTAHRSVLMMVLKAGATSTLDIISGIKQKVIDVKDQLPDALKIGFIGDQSVFVRAAISGVVREAIIAAADSLPVVDILRGVLPQEAELLRLVQWCDVFFQNNISLRTAWLSRRRCAPSSRFSSTVSDTSTWRPSGTSTSPCASRRCGRALVISAPP